MRFTLLAVISAIACACGTTDYSVGPCRALQIDNVGEKLLAVCWSEEAQVLEAVNRPELIGPEPRGALGLFERFASARDNLKLQESATPSLVSGFRYHLSHPAIVQERAQYNLDVTLPRPLPATAIDGPAKEIADFVKQKHPTANIVNLDLIPMSSDAISVSLHFTQWDLTGLTLSQYRSKR